MTITATLLLVHLTVTIHTSQSTLLRLLLTCSPVYSSTKFKLGLLSATRNQLCHSVDCLILLLPEQSWLFWRLFTTTIQIAVAKLITVQHLPLIVSLLCNVWRIWMSLHCQCLGDITASSPMIFRHHCRILHVISKIGIVCTRQRHIQYKRTH